MARIVDADQVAERITVAITGHNDNEVKLSVARFLRLYQGDFLAGDKDQPWSMQARDQERAKFMEALDRAGAYFESESEWSSAQEVYGSGLAVDNLAEPFYRGLIRGHLARCEPAEALRVYRRCRELLSIVLNVQPSEESKRLVRYVHA